MRNKICPDFLYTIKTHFKFKSLKHPINYEQSIYLIKLKKDILILRDLWRIQTRVQFTHTWVCLNMTKGRVKEHPCSSLTSSFMSDTVV